MGSLVVLISGRGSNLQAILESPVGGQVTAVFSDHVQAGGLDIARRFGKPVHVCPFTTGRRDSEHALTRQIKPYRPDLIALAGFMRVLSADFIAAHGGRLVNIHPSLLPEFRGLHTHRRVLAAGTKEHGCTVHWVTAELDGGDIIAQSRLTVRPDDDEAGLAARVLTLEHRLYPQVLAQLLNKEEQDIA